MNLLGVDKTRTGFDAFRVSARSIIREPLGQRTVLQRPESGCIVTTDTFGMQVLTALQESDARGGFEESMRSIKLPFETALADDAIHVADAIIEGWDAVGLFDSAPKPFPIPAKDDPSIATQAANYVTEFGSVTVKTNDEPLLNEIDLILANAVSSGAGSQRPTGETFRCLRSTSGTFGLFGADKPIWGQTDRDEARFILLREAAAGLCGGDRVGAVLHGAAVLCEQGAVVLIGESGQGKSTLAQGLVSEGFGFLADDHIPLHRNGTDAMSFPTAASVKEGSLDLPEIEALHSRFEMLGGERDGVVYIPISPGAPIGTQIPIRAVIVPRFLQTAKYRLTKLSPEDIFTTLIMSGARPTSQNPEILPLVRLCNTVPAYALEYSTSEQSLSACQNLFQM